MQKRDIVKAVLAGEKPPYVPWSFSFTVEANEKLIRHFDTEDIIDAVDNHIIGLGSDIGFFDDIGNSCVRDVFGVEWDRSVDKDIGIVKGTVLDSPSLNGYSFPDPLDKRFFERIPSLIGLYGDRYRVYQIGFSLFERAWTLRGMEHLLMDFYDNVDFVDELFNTIADYNIAQVKKALEFDIDAVYFGDDWGQQRGLIMGPEMWRRYIKPVLKRMYSVVREAGKKVFIHSCGDVQEVFDDLVEIGLNCFNPFQPEVMDTAAIHAKYRGQLSFFGGLSTQKTLPYGSVDDVTLETQRLINMGADGGYILSPAHAVEGDVPLENMLAFITTVKAQAGYKLILSD